jgi:hypothetical protein
MPIKTFRVQPQTVAEWDRFFRDAHVAPSTNSVTSGTLIDGSVTEPKLDANSVSTRTILDNAVTDRCLRNSGACSVIGRSDNTSGDPADITFTADDQLLIRRSGVVQAGTLVDTDIPATIARDTEVSAAVAAHVAAVDPHTQYALDSDLATHVAAADPHPVYPLAGGTETISGQWTFSLPVGVPSYTVAGVPSAATAALIIYVSNESGGAVLAFSDGTNWRRVTDRAVIS